MDKLRFNLESFGRRKTIYESILELTDEVNIYDVYDLIAALKTAHLRSVPDILPVMFDAFDGFALQSILGTWGMEEIMLAEYSPGQIIRALQHISDKRDLLVLGDEIPGGEWEIMRLRMAFDAFLNAPPETFAFMEGLNATQLDIAIHVLRRFDHHPSIQKYFAQQFQKVVDNGVPSTFVWKVWRVLGQHITSFDKKYTKVITALSQALYERYPHGVDFVNSPILVNIQTHPDIMNERYLFLKDVLSQGVNDSQFTPMATQLDPALSNLQLQVAENAIVAQQSMDEGTLREMLKGIVGKGAYGELDVLLEDLLVIERRDVQSRLDAFREMVTCWEDGKAPLFDMLDWVTIANSNDVIQLKNNIAAGMRLGHEEQCRALIHAALNDQLLMRR